MNSNCLICELKNNSFTLNASTTINGNLYVFPIKIDTGCTYSVLPFRSIANISKDEAMISKKKAILDKLPYIRSYGVSDTSFKKSYDKFLIKIGFLRRCTSIKFLHHNLNITLNNFEFISDIYINYDRTSSPLLGLDILKNFSFICDKSKLTGKYMFIGCHINQTDKHEFYENVIKHFGINYIYKVSQGDSLRKNI